jgi:hypothetical protein
MQCGATRCPPTTGASPWALVSPRPRVTREIFLESKIILTATDHGPRVLRTGSRVPNTKTFATLALATNRSSELAAHPNTTRSGAGKSLGEESTSRCRRSHRSGRPRRMFFSLVAGERREAAPRPRRAATSSANGLDVTDASAIRLAVRPLLGTSPRVPRRQPVVRPWCSPRP